MATSDWSQLTGNGWECYHCKGRGCESCDQKGKVDLTPGRTGPAVLASGVVPGSQLDRRLTKIEKELEFATDEYGLFVSAIDAVAKRSAKTDDKIAAMAVEVENLRRQVDVLGKMIT